MADQPRIAIIVSHPIQHFCPQYASLARRGTIRLKVFFASALGLKQYRDRDFGTEISWTNLRLDQFDHCFLNGEAALPADKTLDAPGLETALQEYRPHIMIVYGYFQAFQRRAYRWAKKERVALAYISDSERRQYRNPVKEWIKYPYIRKYFSGIDYFLSVGDANEAFYRYYSVPAARIIRMHFPIDLELYAASFEKKQELRKKYRSQYDIADEETVLAVAGKLVPWKRQDDILDALALLEKQNRFMRLFVIGSGEMEAALREKAKKLNGSKVHFTGFVQPEALPGFYAATDIYVHPASVEPHSLAISEAVYMGCPAIISDRCGSSGPGDDVQEGTNGYVYACGNIGALAARIDNLSGNPATRKQFGEHAHAIAAGFQQRAHGGFMDELLSKYFKDHKN